MSDTVVNISADLTAFKDALSAGKQLWDQFKNDVQNPLSIGGKSSPYSNTPGYNSNLNMPTSPGFQSGGINPIAGQMGFNDLIIASSFAGGSPSAQVSQFLRQPTPAAPIYTGGSMPGATGMPINFMTHNFDNVNSRMYGNIQPQNVYATTAVGSMNSGSPSAQGTFNNGGYDGHGMSGLPENDFSNRGLERYGHITLAPPPEARRMFEGLLGNMIKIGLAKGVSDVIGNASTWSNAMSLAGGNSSAQSEAMINGTEGMANIIPFGIGGSALNAGSALTGMFGGGMSIAGTRAQNIMSERINLSTDQTRELNVSNQQTILASRAASGNPFASQSLQIQANKLGMINQNTNQYGTVRENAILGQEQPSEERSYLPWYANFSGIGAAYNASSWIQNKWNGSKNIQSDIDTTNTSSLRSTQINAQQQKQKINIEKLTDEQQNQLNIESQRQTGNNTAQAWGQYYSNNFKPVEGALNSLVGGAKSDFDAYNKRLKSGFDMNDLQLTMSNLELNRQDVGAQQRDLRAMVLGGRGQRIGAYESALAYADPMQENMAAKAGAINVANTDIQQMINVLKAILAAQPKTNTTGGVQTK